MALTEFEEIRLLNLMRAEAHSNRYFEHLFKQQRQVIRHPAKRKIARCSRRAGKTELACDYLLKTAEDYPGTISVYIALTRKSAKRLMWGRLKKRSKELGIKGDFSETDLMYTLENGSEIWLLGANSEDTAETLRGPKYKLVIFDECASFRGHIETLIEEIIEPATMDEDGTILMIGTPSWDFSSYFKKANEDKENWQSFHWTMLENPFLPKAAEWLAALKKRRGWSDDNPVLLREYFGQWSKSDNDMVYQFNPLINVIVGETPVCEFHYLGVDLGFEDEAAFGVIGHNRNSRDVYILKTEKFKQWLPHQVAAHIQKLDKQYDFFRMVCDEGGLGKMVAEEFRQRYAIPIVAATKTEKRNYIEFFNSGLKEGHIKVAEGDPVITEWNQLIWDEKKKIEAPGSPNHCSDATLYAWRESLAYLEQALQSEPEKGSEAWFDSQERAILKQREHSLKNKASDPLFSG